ncbi:hypothetical protein ACFFX0_01735 [Citricoccus parietis]|uniref:SnoaL-like domain-containing protein n=1 Tax=Citricoccus parietis TaxID=592307 RepID=A0ABV5FTK1_9MICC
MTIGTPTDLVPARCRSWRMMYSARSVPRSSTSPSKDSIHSAVSCGSLSDIWLVSPLRMWELSSAALTATSLSADGLRWSGGPAVHTGIVRLDGQWRVLWFHPRLYNLTGPGCRLAYPAWPMVPART